MGQAVPISLPIGPPHEAKVLHIYKNGKRRRFPSARTTEKSRATNPAFVLSAVMTIRKSRALWATQRRQFVSSSNYYKTGKTPALAKMRFCRETWHSCRKRAQNRQRRSKRQRPPKSNDERVCDCAPDAGATTCFLSNSAPIRTPCTINQRRMVS